MTDTMVRDAVAGVAETGPVVILGGAGKTGVRVADRLARKGVPFRLASRSTEPAFDWTKPEGWADAIDGAGALYIAYQPDLAVPGALDAVRTLVAVAKDKGVGRLVLLSGRGEAEAEAGEAIVRDSGLPWTIVRAAWFAQNFSESFLLDAVRAGEVALPARDIGEPFVDADDIADVAAAALSEDGHEGQLYEVTGPRLLTHSQAVAEIAAAAGRPVTYRQVPPDAFADGMRAASVPQDMAYLVLYLMTTIMDGRNAQVADGVERALGRPPRDFADYARRAAATGVWEGA